MSTAKNLSSSATITPSSPRPTVNRRSTSYQHKYHTRSSSSNPSRPTSTHLSMTSTAPSLPSSKSMTLYPHRERSSSSGYHTSSQTPSSAPLSLQTSSRFPPTDTLSYFPPFESMGSGEISSTEARTTDESNVGESSKRSAGQRTHSKGKSIGSIAGFVNSLGFLSGTIRKSASPPRRPLPLFSQSSDGDVIQALTQRVTPGKRKVLETVSQANGELPFRKVSSPNPSKSKDLDISTQQSRRPDLHLPLPTTPAWSVPLPSPPVTSISPLIPSELFDYFVENPVITPTSIPPQSGLNTSSSDSMVHFPSFRRSSSYSNKLSPNLYPSDPELGKGGLSPVSSSSFSTLMDSMTSDITEEPCTPERSWVQGMITPPTLAFSDSVKSFSSQLIETAANDKADGPHSSYQQNEPNELDDHARDTHIAFSNHLGYLGEGLGLNLNGVHEVGGVEIETKRPRANSNCSSKSADSNATIRPSTYKKLQHQHVTPKAVGRGWRAGESNELDEEVLSCYR